MSPNQSINWEQISNTALKPTNSTGVVGTGSNTNIFNSPGLTYNTQPSGISGTISTAPVATWYPSGTQSGLSNGALVPTSPTPTPASGGGGGQVLGANVESTSGSDASQQDLNAQLDAIFNPVFDSLKGQEDVLNSNYNTANQNIYGEYGNSVAALAQQNTQGQRELAQQETAAGTRKEDALTSATRLYDELRRGGQQRFGGASSAGEAFQTLTATEQQRRQGTIQGAFETAMQQIGTFKANLQEKFLLATKELETQKNAALAEAKSSFDSAMQSIREARNQATSDKATASLNILQDLRNKVYTINQQALSFAQQLALNHEATLAQVDKYTQAALASVQGGNQTLTSSPLTNYRPVTAYGNSAGQTSTIQTLTGRISKPTEEDQA